jgi:hypothetical protein
MSDAELDAWMDAVAAVLGLEIAPEWRDAVRLHLRITSALPERVMAFPLSDEADPLPVYRA